MRPLVLIVDDEAPARYGMRRALEREGYEIIEADSVSSAQPLVRSRRPQTVLLDIRLASDSGLEYLPSLVSEPQPPVVIIVTAHGNERLAVEAIKRGAFDYLAKPFEIDELRMLVRNAVEVSRLRAENEALKHQLANTETFGGLVGSSPPIRAVYSLIGKVAPTGISVLITGESGTGKEVTASEIHVRSGRSGSLVAVNCAALPADLIESELFGHEKGAFTGATSRRMGKFEAASGGTLFLDEIGDMSLATQSKLLRVLEEKLFQRLGSNENLSADVRVITATNKDLEAEVAAKRFREDLYYRICGVTIRMPALRDRKPDIPALIRFFSDRFSAAYKGRALGIPEAVYKVSLDYHWPGNIRQLRNSIERAVVLSDDEDLSLKVLSEELRAKPANLEEISPEGDKTAPDPDFKEAKREFERKYIERCLERAGWNITQAAGLLGLHRQSLQHKIKELGLMKKYL
jgi:DNA-binding NtrC family response regulator